MPAKSIKVLRSPVADNFTHWFESAVPYGLESLNILSDPQIPTRIEKLKQTDAHPLRRHKLSLHRKDPLLRKKMKIESSLSHFAELIKDGGFIKPIIPSLHVVKERYDALYVFKRFWTSRA